MSNRTISRNLAIACLATLAILPACASGVANLVRDSRLTIHVDSPRKTTLSVSGIYQQGEYVEISGRVWRHRLSPSGLYSGHVDVEIVDPDGTVTATTGVPTFPRFIKRGLRHAARFSTQVGAQIEQGTVVRLRFHRGKHDGVVFFEQRTNDHVWDSANEILLEEQTEYEYCKHLIHHNFT